MKLKTCNLKTKTKPQLNIVSQRDFSSQRKVTSETTATKNFLKIWELMEDMGDSGNLKACLLCKPSLSVLAGQNIVFQAQKFFSDNSVLMLHQKYLT